MIQTADVLAELRPAAVLEHYGIKFARSGAELRTRQCPACGQRTTDAVAINGESGAWCCHRCNARGDVLAAVAGYEGLDIRRDYPRVIELAAQVAGIVTTSEPDPERERRIAQRRQAEAAEAARVQAERAALRAAMPDVWARLARTNRAGAGYLASRGLDAAAVQARGDVLRFRSDGAPAVPLRDLTTGDLIGIQFRQLAGEPKVLSETGSTVSGAVLAGNVAEVDEGQDVAVIVEGLADTLAARIAFPTCAVFGAPGWSQLEAVAAAVAPRIAAVRGWLLVFVDDDKSGREGAKAAARAAMSAGLRLVRENEGNGSAGSVRLIELGAHHDLADAHAAGWRWQWPEGTR